MEHEQMPDTITICNTNNITDKKTKKIGKWFLLPVELIDKILYFLADADMCGYLNVTSKTTFVPSERVYHYLCEMIYLKQTKKKKLVVENWKSYKNVLIFRPRLRTNGLKK